jgi:UDP-N-acetylglucosamine--N-acetylmuramyl-(pentapeptide) pyrophosphoryl-undecaprenol N-acetylglucosamine transferase
MRVPAILIPYPAATDNHQLHNARALTDVGAAVLLQQAGASGEKLAALASTLIRDTGARQQMAEELVRWHSPHAAELIVEKMLALVSAMGLCEPGDFQADNLMEPRTNARAMAV